MAKENLKVGDLVQWGVPGVDPSLVHAMVIDYWDGRGGDVPFWTAMRGDGTKWTVARWSRSSGNVTSRGNWWSIAQIGGDRRMRVQTSSVLV